MLLRIFKKKRRRRSLAYGGGISARNLLIREIWVVVSFMVRSGSVNWIDTDKKKPLQMAGQKEKNISEGKKNGLVLFFLYETRW